MTFLLYLLRLQLLSYSRIYLRRDAHFQAFASSASETLEEWARRPKLQATALPVTSTTEIATVQKSSKRIVCVSSDDDEPIVFGPPAPKRQRIDDHDD